MHPIRPPVPTHTPLASPNDPFTPADAEAQAVAESIARDIARTFPEHPQFSNPEGQQALYRLLRAYSVADPEVGDGLIN